jgi:hypothetical protein
MFLQSVDPMDMIGHAAMCGAVLCLHSRDQIVVHPDGIFRHLSGIWCAGWDTTQYVDVPRRQWFNAWMRVPER